ncbi:calponin homology domain-containing protein, partial [Thamnocephalis sphaerospora]
RKLASMFEEVQKKTFTKWLNVQLRDTDQVVEALEFDLRDGKTLLALLYTLARRPIPAAERGTMRIHRMANVSKALRFLEAQLGGPLMNVGAEDIVDGN